MFRKIDYISVCVNSVLNSFLNCSAYSDFLIPVFQVSLRSQIAVSWVDGFDGRYRTDCCLVRICDTTEWLLFIDSTSFFRI